MVDNFVSFTEQGLYSPRDFAFFCLSSKAEALPGTSSQPISKCAFSLVVAFRCDRFLCGTGCQVQPASPIGIDFSTRGPREHCQSAITAAVVIS